MADGKIGTSESTKHLVEASTAGQVVEASNGMKMIVGNRNDLLASNGGRVFQSAKPRGSAMSFGGADMVTNSAGERVIKGSEADDTADAPKQRRAGRPPKATEPAEPAPVG
jgi:hypothetical protein